VSEVVGYFAWVRINGRCAPEKFHVDRNGMNVEASKTFTQTTVRKWPLNKMQWEMLGLDELAEMFPLPDNGEYVS
jgi:hypothetical protein